MHKVVLGPSLSLCMIGCKDSGGFPPSAGVAHPWLSLATSGCSHYELLFLSVDVFFYIFEPYGIKLSSHDRWVWKRS